VRVAKHRKIGSESEARRCLAAVKGSGMSLKDWARGHGIDGRSLHAWKMNLERCAPSAPKRKASAAKGTPLVELVPAPASPPSRYVLHLGVGSVEFGDDFLDETLRRVVGVLRSC
jgi:hypothetical protein